MEYKYSDYVGQINIFPNTKSCAQVIFIIKFSLLFVL